VRRENVCLGFFVVHFALISAVSLHQTLWLVAKGRTLLPRSAHWRTADAIFSTILGERLAAPNPLRQAVATYLNAAGIEGGYGFFAPSVPDNYKLVLELHYSTGKIETVLPEVGEAATGKRLANLLDYIGRTPHEELRVLLIKMLAYSVWRSHSDATSIRAVFGFVKLPSMDDFKHGKKEAYQFLYAYDFHFRTEARKSAP
jgi:hypothetical protein